MEIWGSAATFNLENVLRQNILGSDYYKQTCLQLSNWSDIVDEIYESVDHVEPWMSGNARGASTAFCLLHRLFTIKLNQKQVKDMLDHQDSPYIRAVGFLYLRYVADPKTLWGWCGPYVKDKEQFSPSGPGQKAVTMGDFVLDLLLGQYYFETIFPRIPKPVQDSMNDELKSRGLPTTAKGNGGAGGADRRGVDDAGNKRPASVKASLSVAFGQRAPNRSGAREEGRGRDPLINQRDGGSGRGRPSASPEPPTRGGSAPRDVPADSRHGGREREARDDRSARDYRDRERDRDRDRDRRSRSRSRDGRDRDYDRDRRDRRRSISRERSDRDRDRGRGYDRERERDRYDRQRDARDVFRESAPSRSGRDDDTRAKYGSYNGSSRDRGRDEYRSGSQR